MAFLGLSLTTWLGGGVVCLLLWLTSRRPRGLPPGPALCLPLVGHLPLLVGRDPRQVFRDLSRRYGDVFHLYLGPRLVVVLSSYDVIKEALVKQADLFSDRADGFVSNTIRKKMGVVGSSGTTWKEQRKFALGALSEFASGRSSLQDKIMEEVLCLTEVLQEKRGQTFDPCPQVTTAVSNVICSVVFGRRFDYGDPLLTSSVRLMREVLDNVGSTAVVNCFPFLRHVPGDPFKYKRILDSMSRVESSLIEPAVQEHLENFDPSNTNMDFIDAYIKEIRKAEAEGTPTTLNVENLVTLIGDLFVAGTDTTSTTLLWVMVIFLNFPEVQDKVFEEIQSKVGSGRAVRLEDRADLPYVEAFIMEVLRFTAVAFLGLPHGTSGETRLRGYCLPPGTEVLTNLDAVLHDPALWDEPWSFRPQRFLQQDGRLVRPEEFISFSTGRRACLGKNFAQVEIFLFLVNLAQHFRFECEDGSEPPSLEGVSAIVHVPLSFKVKAVPRF